jgi:hypothetical protein
MLKTVVYTSQVSHPMGAHHIEQLVQMAQVWNTQRGLTGMLLCSERGFGQCLEGPADAVDERMDAIRTDLRHRNVRVLLEALVETREFAGWSMGYASIYEGTNREQVVRRLLETTAPAAGSARQILADAARSRVHF